MVSKGIRNYLLSAQANATYMSLNYISKYINIIYNDVKLPWLESLSDNLYTFLSDEAIGITSIEPFAIYTTFEHNKIIPLSKLVGISLSVCFFSSSNVFSKN